jgi:hypothetical protein
MLTIRALHKEKSFPARGTQQQLSLQKSSDWDIISKCEKLSRCLSILLHALQEKIDIRGSGNPIELSKLWQTHHHAPRNSGADSCELFLFNPRWLPEGDRKKEYTDRTGQDKDISNAFHVNKS